MDDGVLAECRNAHEVQDRFAVAAETRRSIAHKPRPLFPQFNQIEFSHWNNEFNDSKHQVQKRGVEYPNRIIALFTNVSLEMFTPLICI